LLTLCKSGAVIDSARKHQPINVDGDIKPKTDLVGECDSVKKVSGLMSGNVLGVLFATLRATGRFRPIRHVASAAVIIFEPRTGHGRSKILSGPLETALLGIASRRAVLGVQGGRLCSRRDQTPEAARVARASRRTTNVVGAP
jgi:hypothetical protein